jgi:hypothetical protein
VLLAAALAGCGAHASTRALAPLVDCLSRSGAPTVDVTASRDLQVSGGEVAVRFSTFDAYVGLAQGRGQARSAARALDRDLLLFQQAGTALVHGGAVYYFDAPIVPPAASRLVTACLDGSRAAALDAFAALSLSLPQVELSPAVRRSFLARCHSASCDCAFDRAERVYPPAQVATLGPLAVDALRRVCSRDQAAVRTGRQTSGTNQRAAPSVPPIARIVVGATA